MVGCLVNAETLAGIAEVVIIAVVREEDKWSGVRGITIDSLSPTPAFESLHEPGSLAGARGSADKMDAPTGEKGINNRDRAGGFGHSPFYQEERLAWVSWFSPEPRAALLIVSQKVRGLSSE